MKMKLKLRTKAVAMIVAFALLLMVATITVSYFAYERSLNKSYGSLADKLTGTVAMMLDQEVMEKYIDVIMEQYTQNPRPEVTDEAYYEAFAKLTDGEDYAALFQQLKALKEENDVMSLYVVSIDPKSESAVYIVDGDDGEMGCPAGTWDIIYEENAGIFSNPELGFPAYVTNTEEFGWLCSGGSPIYGSDGGVIGYVMVDISMNEIMHELWMNLLFLFVLQGILTAILLAIMIYAINRTVVSPINHLSNAAKLLVRDMASDAQSQTGTESELSKLQIKSQDEIGALCRSVQFMEREIKEYINNLAVVTAERERIGAELDVAKHIQASMLPCIFPAFPERKEFDIYATMTPAKEVGGDFYDFFMLDDRHLAIVMADVSGKGVPAALFMVIGKTLIKDHTQSNRDLGEVFTEVNNLLCASNSEEMFITAFEGVLDLTTGEFRFVNAGHEMPFICKKGEGFKPQKIRAGFVLAGMEGIRYRAGEMQLEVGDKLFQYTDGVTEATNSQKELYGMERLEKTLSDHAQMAPTELLPAVKADVDAFVGEAEQFDDITMLCLEYKEKMES